MPKHRFALAALSIVVLAAAACGGDDGGDPTAEAALPAEATTAASTAAPEATGTVAAPTDGSSVLDELLDRAAAFEEVATWGRGVNGVTFEAPNGLTIDADAIYVTEFQGGHLRKFASDGSLLFEVAGNGVDPGNLGNPIGVAVAPDGTILVSESGNSRISAFNADGSFRTIFAGPGGEPGQFRSAMGIAVSDAGEVFVADFGNHRVQVFTSDGGFVRTWGEFGDGPGQLNNPIGLQIGPAGNVWVVDTGNERVQVFDQQGELLRSYDDVGAGPQIISLNAEGEFYVSSPWADSRVRRFSPDGELLSTVGLSATPDELGQLSPDELATIEAIPPLRGPHGTATDSTGAVYVADTANGIVRKFVPAAP